MRAVCRPGVGGAATGPDSFQTGGYENFSRTTGDEVRELLARDPAPGGGHMIRKLKSGEYRLYSRKADPKTGKRRNLGTFPTRAAAEKHEREVQYFKRH